MNRDEKAAAIAEIASDISESQAIFAVDPTGLTVAQAAEIRTNLRGQPQDRRRHVSPAQEAREQRRKSCGDR